MSSALARRQSRSPCMAHRFLAPSIANLPAAMMVNGVSVLPTFRYKGGDANASGWPAYGYGSTLNYDATGNVATFNNGSPLLGSSDDSVKFDGANNCRTFAGPNNAYANLGYNDLYFEALIKVVISTNATHCYLAKDSGISQNMYRLVAINNVIYFGIRQDDSIETRAGYTYSGEQWVLLQAYYNNSIVGDLNALKVFSNGVLQTTAKSGSPQPNFNHTNTGKIRFGREYDSTGTRETPGNIGYAGMWLQPSWFADDSFTELTTVAQTRFAQLTATKPWIARGSSAPTISKASPSFIDKYESGSYQKYYLGVGWAGIHATSATRRGLLIEPQRQNLALQSCTLGTTWTQVALASITNNSGVGLDGSAYLDGIIGTADDTQHGVTQAVTLTAAKYCLSCAGHPGNKNWVYLFDSTVANCWAYFDLANGVVGTKGAGCTAGIIPKKFIGDNYIPFIVFDGTVAAHTIGAYAAHADEDNDFAGDATTINLHLGDMQVCRGTYPTSRIITAASAVTRAAATFRYAGQYNLGEGEGAFRTWIHAPAFTPDVQHTIFCASVAGAATDLIRLYVDTDGAIKFASAATGGNDGAGSVATNICTEREVEVLLTWRKNLMNVCVDGTWGTPDTSVDIPASIDRIDLCCDNAGVTQLGPIELLDFKIENKYRASWWDRGGGFTHNA